MQEEGRGNDSCKGRTREQEVQNILYQETPTAWSFVRPFRVYIQGCCTGRGRVTDRLSMGNVLRIKHYFSCLVSGPSGSGNSSFCIRFCKISKHSVPSLTSAVESSGGILEQRYPYRQLAGKEHVRFHEGVLADINSFGKKPCLIILDDLLNDAYAKDVCDLFTKGRNHRNISVILITQNLFHQGKYSRDISLKAKYIVGL